MLVNFLYKDLQRIRQFARKTIVRYDYAKNLAPLKYDSFVNKSLPVPKCAGSFFISQNLKNEIKNIDVYSLEILINKKMDKIKIKDQPKLTDAINELLESIPELMHIFAPKTQYKGGLDKHVLATYQQLVIHPEYKRLSPKYQQVLELAALGHDTGKAFELGSNHPLISAKILSKRFESLDMNENEKRMAIKLIRYHHYSENIAKGRMSYENYARIFNEKEFKLLKILIDADIKSKNKPVQYRLDENKIFFAEQEALFKANSQPQKVLELIA